MKRHITILLSTLFLSLALVPLPTWADEPGSPDPITSGELIPPGDNPPTDDDDPENPDSPKKPENPEIPGDPGIRPFHDDKNGQDF